MSALRAPATLIAAVGVIAAVVGCAAAGAAPGSRRRWVPPPRPTWYWQLQGPIDNSVPATVYDVDLFDTTTSEVGRLHALGKRVVCYVDVGTWESWRPDASRFPRAVLGTPDAGWPGERWLDIRDLRVLEPIVTARLRLCARKGFDGVEPDNIEQVGNATGFPTTLGEQLRYADWVAAASHSVGLAVFQKNDPAQAHALQAHFDGALVEQCNQYSDCSAFAGYLRANKPVLNAEYERSLYPAFCEADRRAGIMGALYGLALDGRLFKPCWSA